MNIPNILTVLRVILIPLFVIAFLVGGINIWVAFAIFVLAAVTDFLDGYIARKKNLVTDFGKLMDPLADKILVMSAFICFTYAGIFHPAVTIVVMSREFLVTGIRMLASSKGKIMAADILGKLKTISQDVTAILVLFKCSIGAEQGSFIGTLTICITCIMVILTICSGINYCIKNKEIFEKM